MKFAKSVMKLAEAASGTLTEDQLKKFWKSFQDNVFKQSKDVIKNDYGLFLDGVELNFHGVDFEKNGEFEKKFYRDPEHFIADPSFISQSVSNLISTILNEFTLEEASTEEQDQQALEYFLKHFKGSEVFFYGENKVNNDVEVDFYGVVKVKNFKYDARNDELLVTDLEIKQLNIGKL